MASNDTPEGVFSLLDTDLYKLTMQCAVLKYFPDAHVRYQFTNRTPHMRFTREAFEWLETQINKLENIQVTAAEIEWLRKTCPYLTPTYLDYLSTLRLHPSSQVEATFTPITSDSKDPDALGDVILSVSGVWVETILYEIPLLALTSEAYFKFVDRDWNHDGQLAQAKEKGERLLESGCVFSEFGSRRRRDYKTHAMIIEGLMQAKEEAETNGRGWKGKFTGTSNVHLAMKYGVNPTGTVAHEWFMGIAAITQDYASANELALQYWIGTFGRGVLGIALTDTFGTPSFLKAFAQPAPKSGTTEDVVNGRDPTYAQIFTGVRQDSGDPVEYVKMISQFYDAQGIKDPKTVIFSDSLNIARCIQYKEATEAVGLTPAFGVGTFFTNDFVTLSTKEKSVPLNIVIKLCEANGNSAIKLSDDTGKNMGNDELMRSVKAQVGYEEKSWRGGDEAHRWDKNDS
ncbi:related to nicotinate phosphoribosyltransferase [Ramularia collo-cygni]|uniref:Nicotinate phosphoribosyltransferase n=1 Tax=Ramularia collo-cygni TaxID=112498 RepID=A0A2D3VIW0_9PEZI|nr:related to nicotinate phosphoribosyltransferase [Ramularia collo-cygni]CZT25382.1 related to nicotinate phosphoribosyltransferase [Ramularia collo-cygni]